MAFLDSLKLKKPKKASDYIDASLIEGIDANIKFLMGGRNSGKSWYVKNRAVKDAIKNGNQFVYIRRYDKDFTGNGIEAYFSDCDIHKISNGLYDAIIARGTNIYAASYDEDYQLIKGPRIGYGVALNLDERIKSRVYTNIGTIIFEEFVPDTDKYVPYLPNEPERLLNVFSTIGRDKAPEIWLIGNLLDAASPYFYEWQLTHTAQQAIGTIDTYELERFTEDGTKVTTKFAVQKCFDRDVGNPLVFGKSTNTLLGKDWKASSVQTFPCKREEVEMIYEVEFHEQNFSLALQLYCNPNTGGEFVFIYPLNPDKPTRRFLRHITSDFSTDILTTTGFDDNIEAEVLMRKYIKNGRVAYANNMTENIWRSLISQRRYNL